MTTTAATRIQVGTYGRIYLSTLGEFMEGREWLGSIESEIAGFDRAFRNGKPMTVVDGDTVYKVSLA